MKKKSINDMMRQLDVLKKWIDEKPAKRFKYNCIVMNTFYKYLLNIYEYLGLPVGIDAVNIKRELVYVLNDVKFSAAVYMGKEATK